MKSFTQRFVILLFFLGCSLIAFSQKDFYDTGVIQDIKITFEAKNWRYLLDSLRYNGDDLLAGKVEINGQKLEGIGVRYRDARAFTPGGRRNGLFVQLDWQKGGQTYQNYEALDLSSALRDPSMIREVLGYEIARQYMPAPKANYAKVFINGEYYGLFVNQEHISTAFLTRNFGHATGSLFSSEPNTVEQAPDGCKAKAYASLQQDFDERCFKHHFKGSKDANWSKLVEVSQVMAESPDRIPQVLDVDNALWMLAFNNLLVNLASYTGQYSQHYELYENADGRMVPIIGDLNLAFGSFKNTGAGSDLKTRDLLQLDPMLHANDPTKPLISVLLANETFKKQYFSHMRTIMADYFTSGKFEQRARELQKLIADALNKDANRYYTIEDYNRSLLETIGTRSNIPGILDFMNKRVDYLTQLEDFKIVPPTISNVGVTKRERFSNQQLNSFKIQAKADNYPKSLRIVYRFENSIDFMEANMVDDGQHNDGTAGDGVFGVEIKPQGGAQRIDYYIIAENARAISYYPARYMYEWQSSSLAEINK